MAEFIFCINCMEEKGNNLICPHCRYDERHYEPHPSHLVPYTVLNKKYLVGRVLGQGGFGITYIGLDMVLHKKVAIKEFFPKDFADRSPGHPSVMPLSQQQTVYFNGLRQFLKEARTIVKFEEHQNIVDVYEFFEEHDTAYIIMKFLEGESLSDRLAARGGIIEVEEALPLLFPIFDALKSLHGKNFCHRDVSPQNIILTGDDRPVLIDFGAARQIIGGYTKSLNVILKPGYSPFEQYTSNGKIGPWTDVYACGATLYRMICGIVPPPAPDRMERDTLKQPLDISELHPQISAKLNDTILRSLSVRAGDRFQTIDAFEKALRKSLEPHRPSDVKRGMPLPAIVAGVLGGLVVLGFLLFLFDRNGGPGSQPTPTPIVISGMNSPTSIPTPRPVLPSPTPRLPVTPTLVPIPTTDNREVVYNWVQLLTDKGLIIHREFERLRIKKEAHSVAAEVDTAMADAIRKQIGELERNIDNWLKEYGNQLDELQDFEERVINQEFANYQQTLARQGEVVGLNMNQLAQQHFAYYLREGENVERWRRDLQNF